MANPQSANFDNWYAVHCKPFGERRAAVILEDHLGLPVYLPEIQERFHGQIRRAVFFPRYLFVWANLQLVTLNRIKSTPGVLRLVAFDDLPQPVPAEVIETIREQVDLINASGGLPEYHFRSGDAVRLAYGPLRGLEAIFVRSIKSSARAQVLIDFLGRLSATEVDMEDLERPGGAPLPKRERRTRGKGRRIKAHS